MAFKLGSSNRGFNIPKNKKSNTGVETPIIRKSLGEGIKGEANNDGSIYVSIDIEPGSEEYRNTVMHEMRHAVDMKLGRLNYNDNYVYWDGAKFPRQDGMINYFGEMLEEGDARLPWEPNY